MNEADSLEAQAQQLKRLVYLLNEDRQRLTAQLREVQDVDKLEDTLIAERVLATRLRKQILARRQQGWARNQTSQKPGASNPSKIVRKLTCASDSTEASFSCGGSTAKVRMNPSKMFTVQPPRCVTKTQLACLQAKPDEPHSYSSK